MIPKRVRDHDRSLYWVCNYPEGPFPDAHWSYACYFCLIRVQAAIKSGELVPQNFAHLHELEGEIEDLLRYHRE